MSLFIGFSALLLGSAASSDGACGPLAGWEKVLTRADSQFIIIGEMHGTNESPKVFADAVCLTALHRDVIVGLEQPASNQADIDGFLNSDGGEVARREFLSTSIWTARFKDGRQSEAQFALFEYLRRMKAMGKIRGVVAFQPTNFRNPPSNAEYEQAMADILMSSWRPGVTVVALVGNVHARTIKVSFGEGYLPMAARLPEKATVTYDIDGDGGAFWACMGQPVACGSNSFPYHGPKHIPGVEFATEPDNPFSGTIRLGKPTTASLPQVP